MNQAEIGRLFGIPIVLDFTFILLALLYGFSQFTSGDITAISYGVVLIAGVAFSILLHELGHALAARMYGVPTAYIELNGLGGLCHFARALPASRIANIVVLMAGPAANLVLWKVFGLASVAVISSADQDAPGTLRSAILLSQLAQINFLLLIFNLLPSHPLDGGRALAQLISVVTGYDRAMRIVAYLGMAIVLWVGSLALSGQIFALLIAMVLLQANLSVLGTHSGPRWKRWN